MICILLGQIFCTSDNAIAVRYGDPAHWETCTNDNALTICYRHPNFLWTHTGEAPNPLPFRVGPTLSLTTGKHITVALELVPNGCNTRTVRIHAGSGDYESLICRIINLPSDSQLTQPQGGVAFDTPTGKRLLEVRYDQSLPDLTSALKAAAAAPIVPLYTIGMRREIDLLLNDSVILKMGYESKANDEFGSVAHFVRSWPMLYFFAQLAGAT